jgi:hypothetical protein
MSDLSRACVKAGLKKDLAKLKINLFSRLTLKANAGYVILTELATKLFCGAK